MTLIYLDSSAVIKLFLEEPFSDQVDAAVRTQGARCVTSDLTFAEIHGFLSRARSLGRLDPPQQRQMVEDFRAWFASVPHIAVSFGQVQRAGTFAIQHNLRGADAIHLVAAMESLAVGVGRTRTFACFDQRLTREAQKTGWFDGFLTDPAFLD